jgi:hypothetical protein
MIHETNPTQRSIYTQFSLPPISRNENAGNGPNEPSPVGDKNKLTPPIESSHCAKRADYSSGEAAPTANGSPIKHPATRFQVKFNENGTLKEITYESMRDVPQWVKNIAFANYQKAETLGRTEKNIGRKPQTIINNRYEIMRDKFETQGQIGAVGSNPHVHDTNFDQIWNQTSSRTELKQLADELPKLNEALNREAKTSEHYRAIAEVVDAKEAAKANNGPQTLKHLQNAGKWALGVAEKIGIPLATASLKTALEL